MHYNRANNNFFVNGIEIIKFKTKDSKIVANPVCLGNIFVDDLLAGGMKKVGLYGSVFDLSVDYRIIVADDILDFHKYLMEKNNLK